MSEQRVVSTYRGLMEVLRERRIELGMTQRELDFRCGLADGYVSKLEIWEDRTYGRFMGAKSLDAMMRALGVAFLITKKSVPLGDCPADRLRSANTRGRRETK